MDKFNYLKLLLTGIAQSVVTGLALTSANYEKAVELLKRRFGNRQVVISSHMEALTKIPKVASTSEGKRLRSLYDTVESHVRGLESMEISSEMYGCFLTPIIVQKLPEEFRIAISRNLKSETWDLKEILSEFHKELQLREKCLVNPKGVRRQIRFREVSRFNLLLLCTLKALRTNSFLVCGARFAIKIIRALNVMWSQVLSLESKFSGRKADVIFVSNLGICHVTVKVL